MTTKAPTRRALRRLRQRYVAGEPIDELANEIGRTPATLRWWWRKYGLNVSIPRPDRRPRRQWSYILLRRLRSRYVAGEPVEVLAAEVDVSPKSLTAAWTNYGLAREIPLEGFRRHDWTMARLRKLAARWRSGETLQSIADSIGANVETLSSALQRAGMKSPEIARERRSEIRSRREGGRMRRAYVLRRDTTKTWAQIADEVEWGGKVQSLRSAVLRWCDRAEMPRPPRRSRTGRALDPPIGETTSSR